MTNASSDTLYSNDARFYDLDNREQLKYDISFYLDRASKIKGHILELACGTGRITIPLAEAGHDVWGLEFSHQMFEQFKSKIKNLPEEIADKIHLVHGDMSDFSFDRKFPLIIIPGRSFQLLLDEKKEISCLQNVHHHLTKNGLFIFDLADFIKNKEQEKEWANEEEIFDWENTDPKTGYKIRRTHIKKKIDTIRQIIYPQKTYYITKNDGSSEVEKIVKRSSWKYFFEDQIKNLLISNGFKIIEEMGTFAGEPIRMGTAFIFVCQKK